MKLPNFIRIIKTDYKEEQQDLVDKLAFSINPNLETIYDALNNKLTLSENIACTMKDIDIIVDSSGKPTNISSFQLNNNNKLDGIIVISATNTVNSSIYPTSMPFITYTQNGKIININNISGLQANTLYRLRVVAFNQ